MARSALLIAALAATLLAVSAQCPTNPLAPGLQEFTFTYDGLERYAVPQRARSTTPSKMYNTISYFINVPKTYANRPTPVFFNYHGYTDNAASFNALSGLSIVSEEEGFIGVLPQGYAFSWNGGECCGAAQRNDLDDVGFSRALVERVAAQVCIDRSLLFAAGYSNGNFMSYRLACEASDLYRAVGGNAGRLSGEESYSCRNQTRNIPFIHFHGTADSVISYTGGRREFERYISAEISNCVDQPTVTFRNGSATCETWDQCDGGIKATFCTIEGQDHEWPGCFNGCRGATQDINATREMWKFFLSAVGL